MDQLSKAASSVSLWSKIAQDVCSAQQANLATISVDFFLRSSVWRSKNLAQGCLNAGNLLPSDSRDA